MWSEPSYNNLQNLIYKTWTMEVFKLNEKIWLLRQFLDIPFKMQFKTYQSKSLASSIKCEF